jgi:hypothetical protein
VYEKSWTVERRWTHARWVWRATSEREALDGYAYCRRTLRRGSLHVIDPRGRVVVWCKASDVVALVRTQPA